jgi:hypothetical protein
MGLRNGKQLQRRSYLVTWLRCSCLVRAAQKRSRGSRAFQMFRSPTCGPSGVTMRHTLPAGMVQARPERMGSVKLCVRRRAPAVEAVAAMAS